MKTTSYKLLFILLLGIIFIILLGKKTTPSQNLVDTPTPTEVTTHPNIQNLNIESNQTITSPFTITGAARLWYFEGSFPIEVHNEQGQNIGGGIAIAEGDWMTEDFVPFVAELTFAPVTSTHGYIVLKKDNPSGMQELDDEFQIPILFGNTETTQTQNILIYAYNGTLDNFACSEDGLVALNRTIPQTQTPLTESIQYLINNPLEDQETDSGNTSEFPLSGFSLVSATVQNGVATLTFNDPENTTSGGSCRVSNLRNQIEATALQFDTVQSVVILPETILQP